MTKRALPLLLLPAVVAISPALPAAAADVKLTRADDRVRVEIGGKPFTEYIFKGAPKPFLYPVLAADGTALVRHFPVKKDVDGEVKDHPHHRSLWFTHGAVNGVDFWGETERSGRIVNEAVEHGVTGAVGEIRSRNRWLGPDGAVHLTDQTTLRLRGDGEVRLLDYEVTLEAPRDKPVVFGDTKEGSMAIRLPLWMTPPHSQGKGKHHAGQGVIVTAEGIKNDDTWGKRSAWVDYHAPKDGKTYGVAILDHPRNPRHPTWWHVRSYALFAANPFGQHDFEKLSDKRAGDFKIEAGQRATFRWRFVFHYGDEKAARIAERYRDYAAGQ